MNNADSEHVAWLNQEEYCSPAEGYSQRNPWKLGFLSAQYLDPFIFLHLE